MIFIQLALLLPSSIQGAVSSVKQLSASISKQISENKIKSIGVADFSNPDGTPLPEGLYFADLLSAYLIESRPKFKVLSRDLLLRTFKAQKFPRGGLNSLDVRKRVGALLNLDAVVTGTVNKTAQRLILSVSIKWSYDDTSIPSAEATIDRSPFFDSLSSYPETKTPSIVVPLGRNGVSAPHCLDCPVPQFRSKADADARVLLDVLVSSEGRVTAVKVLRGAGPEFSDEAFRALRVWRYRPARDRSGQTVASSIPIEVYFY